MTAKNLFYNLKTKNDPSEWVKLRDYHDIKNDLTPLSIVLFRGNDFISKIIGKIESLDMKDEKENIYGVWSHVGLLVNRQVMPFVPNIKNCKWAVWEMTCSGKIAGDETPDIATGKGKFGVQVRDLESVLKTYPGSVAILPLKFIPYANKKDSNSKYNSSYEKKEEQQQEEEISSMIEIIKDPLFTLENPPPQIILSRSDILVEKLEKLYNHYNTFHYQYNPFRLFASAFSCIRWLRKFMFTMPDWKMCSDFVASVFIDIGFMSKDLVNSENTLPIDFISDSDGEINTHLFSSKIIILK